MARDLKIELTQESPFYFISYNNSGIEQNHYLIEILQKLNEYRFPMWYDNGIEKGTHWQKEIAERIKTSEAVLLFISNSIFLKEQSYVQKEYELANDFSKKKIIPILLDKIDKTAVPAQYQAWLVDIYHLQCIRTYEFEDVDRIVLEIMSAVDYNLPQSFEEEKQITNSFAQNIVERFKTINSIFTLLDIDYLPSKSKKAYVDLMDIVQRFQEEREGNSLSIDSLINKQIKCIIYGEGGSGKTTFLQHKAYEVSRALINNDKVFPLYIKLSECTENTFIDMSSFLSICEENLNSDDLMLISNLVTTNSKLILFLDGLDEYSVDDNNKIQFLFEQIKQFTLKYNISCIITCRTAYLPVDNVFSKCKLSALSHELSISFTERYFEFLNIKLAVSDFFSMLPNEIRALTGSPLILSMIIAQYYTTKTIPENVDDLYKVIMYQLLEKKPVICDDSFPVAEKFYVLCYLAFNILINGRLSFGYEDSIRVIDERNTYDLPSSKILEDFVHSGIIVNRDNKISFFHTSILEFFSRQEISKEYAFVAKASMDQYFLKDAKKINLIVRCINPSRDDEIIEIGAGIGTVSLQLPSYKRLILVDLDEGLCKILSYNFRNKSECEVICDDAIKVLMETNCKKIISNLPFFMTRDVLNCLCKKSFNVAVMSVKHDDNLSGYTSAFDIEELGDLEGADFFPIQPFKSRLIKVTPKR